MKTNHHRFVLTESLLLLVALHPGLSHHPEYRFENNKSARSKGRVRSISQFMSNESHYPISEMKIQESTSEPVCPNPENESVSGRTIEQRHGFAKGA